MSCHEIESKLSAYIDGELRDNDTEFIRSHIVGCKHCAAKINDLKIIASRTASIPEIDPPAFMVDKILAKTIRRQSFADKLIEILRVNSVYSIVGTASALVLIAVAMWAYQPSSSENHTPAVNISPNISQPDTTSSIATNKNSMNTASTIKHPENANNKIYMRNIRQNRVNQKQYTRQFRNTKVGAMNVSASLDRNKVKKADLKTASSISEKNPVETATDHNLNADNIIQDTPYVDDPNTKAEDTLKVSLVVNDKPAEPVIKTVRVLAAERDNRLVQEVDALKEMRDKLRSRNMNRKYSSYHAQDMNDRTISLHIASVRF